MHWLCFKVLRLVNDNYRTILPVISYRFSFVSVKGQSLEATADSVTGFLGGSVEIAWRLTKKAANDQILSAGLFLGNHSSGEVLYQKGTNDFEKQSYAETNFGDRIQAKFNGEKYTLILSNLTFSDLFTFTFVVNQADVRFNPYPALTKSVKISEVRGMQLLWITLEFIIQFD